MNMYKIIHIGMTGNRHGMSSAQKHQFLSHLEEFQEHYDVVHFHHGDCVGSDKDGHDIAIAAGCITHIHPPIDDKHRAFCAGDHLYKRKEYLVRNRDIVDASSVLLATPDSKIEARRSGTWFTIRYGQHGHDTLVSIIYPDGSIG